jgi:hypothetical protein
MLSGFDLPLSGVDHVELCWRSLQGGVLDIDVQAASVMLTDILDRSASKQAAGPRGGPVCRTPVGPYGLSQGRRDQPRRRQKCCPALICRSAAATMANSPGAACKAACWTSTSKRPR